MARHLIFSWSRFAGYRRFFASRSFCRIRPNESPSAAPLAPPSSIADRRATRFASSCLSSRSNFRDATCTTFITATFDLFRNEAIEFVGKVYLSCRHEKSLNIQNTAIAHRLRESRKEKHFQ
jgi:hypothetical protein